MLAHLCLRALGLKGDTPTAAMIDDYLVCRRHWGFDPADMRVPVTLWHGGSDRLVPLAHARMLAAAIPDCTARVAPGGGHFFYSRSLAEIVGSLVPVEDLAAELKPIGDAADNHVKPVRCERIRRSTTAATEASST